MIEVSVIAAVTEDGVIGYKCSMPWNMPSDLRHFKLVTAHHPVIMGGGTWRSLPNGLQGRLNIIISKKLTTEEIKEKENGARTIIVRDIKFIDNIIKYSNKDIFIIGGAEIYKQLAHHVDKLFITEIKTRVNPLAENMMHYKFFPIDYKSDEWKETKRESFSASDNDDYDYDFVEYERV